MQFDQYTLALLVERDDAPHLDDAETGTIRDAHLAHIASRHDAGHLVTAGPIPFPRSVAEAKGISHPRELVWPRPVCKS